MQNILSPSKSSFLKEISQYPRNINHAYKKPVITSSELSQENLRPKRFKPYVSEEQIERFVKKRIKN